MNKNEIKFNLVLEVLNIIVENSLYEDKFNTYITELSYLVDDEYKETFMEKVTENSIEKAFTLFYSHIIKFICCQNDRNFNSWIQTINEQSRKLSNLTTNQINFINENYSKWLNKSKEITILSFKKYNENISIENSIKLDLSIFIHDINFIINKETYYDFLRKNSNTKFYKRIDEVLK